MTWVSSRSLLAHCEIPFSPHVCFVLISVSAQRYLLLSVFISMNADTRGGSITLTYMCCTAKALAGAELRGFIRHVMKLTLELSLLRTPPPKIKKTKQSKLKS